MKYGYCLNHPKTYAINAKKLCSVCTKERHERSAASKGILTKNARNNENIAITEIDNGTDNTRRNTSFDSLQQVDGSYREPQLAMEVQKQASKKKTKINPISKDKIRELSRLAEIKARKKALQTSECEMCGKQGEVDLFHIIGVGDKKHSTNPLNTLLSCRWCHLIWGANDWSKIVKFKNFDEIMERLKSLDEGKYWKLKHKIDKYYESIQSLIRSNCKRFFRAKYRGESK